MAQEVTEQCRAAMNDYVRDHLNHFNGLPMDFEYNGVIYDYDTILSSLDDDNTKHFDIILARELS